MVKGKTYSLWMKATPTEQEKTMLFLEDDTTRHFLEECSLENQ
jgi:hypothetical protein